MKESRLVQDYLRDILDSMDKAEEFVGDLDLREFKKDDKTAFAVIRSLEIIGEAAKGLDRSPATICRYSVEESGRNARQVDSRLRRGEPGGCGTPTQEEAETRLKKWLIE